jgi:hypothetical protein
MGSPEYNIVGYFHICQKEHWEKSFDLVYEEIKKSGLYDASKEIRCVVVNDANDVVDDDRFRDPKLKITHGSSSAHYERTTLLRMHEAAQEEKCAYWYVHTKGLRHFGTEREDNVIDWIKFMLFWNIANWRLANLCLFMSEVYGCCYRPESHSHFSGNFWWARSDYIRTLPGTIGDDYYAPELWLFSKKPSFVNISDAPVGYDARCPLREHNMIPLAPFKNTT